MQNKVIHFVFLATHCSTYFIIGWVAALEKTHILAFMTQ